jgi:hypothetical protein
METVILIAEILYALTPVVWLIAFWIYEKTRKWESVFAFVTIVIFFYGVTEAMIHGVDLIFMIFGLE